MRAIRRIGARALIEDAADHIEATLKERPTVRLRTGDLVLEANQALSDTDLLIIGKRGEAAGFAKLHLGSNLERMIRSSSCPILVAPRSFKPLGRALIAYDGRSSSKRAVDAIAESALLGLPLTLMTVNERESGNAASLDEPMAVLEQAGFDVQAETLSERPSRLSVTGLRARNSRSWSWAHTAAIACIRC